MPRRVVVVVGNPKKDSRTRAAGELTARMLSGQDPVVIELSSIGTGLLGWGDDEVEAAKRQVAEAQLVVFASPTFKASYTGLLKLFLDQFAGGTGMAGVVAVPLMLGAAGHHALAGLHTLSPVLAELGALPLPALFLIDSTFTEDGTIAAYAERWKESVDRLTLP